MSKNSKPANWGTLRGLSAMQNGANSDEDRPLKNASKSLIIRSRANGVKPLQNVPNSNATHFHGDNVGELRTLLVAVVVAVDFSFPCTSVRVLAKSTQYFDRVIIESFHTVRLHAFP